VVTALAGGGGKFGSESSRLELFLLLLLENKTMTRRPPTTLWRGALIPLRAVGEAAAPGPGILLKVPRGPFKGPRGPFKGPRGPFKGPRGPLK